MVNKSKLLKTRTLEEALTLIFDIAPSGRNCILTQEGMNGEVAREYDLLGKNSRQETYHRIAEDFRIRTSCYVVYHPRTSGIVGSILEIGCGSGLLTLELAERTGSRDIIGLDISPDMITLAQLNLAVRSQERKVETRKFWQKLPEHAKPSPETYQKLEKFPPFLNTVKYMVGSVYNLQKMGLKDVQYIVCRNALHRFQYPERALQEMYNALAPHGVIYIRDLRRDAEWQTVLARIGEQRWRSKTLVRDYVGAMAAMLTPQELEEMLHSLGITTFEITDGQYSHEIDGAENMKEYEKETEYVCVIGKENR